MATQATVFTGASNVGVFQFSVPEFYVSEESVYLNGLRLTRNIDYAVSQTDVSAETYDLIDLTVDKFPNGIVLDTDILEVITPIVTDLSTILTRLDDIAVATYGSWIWDKSTGIMTMLDMEGDERFKFEVSDSAELASRERRQDLE